MPARNVSLLMSHFTSNLPLLVGQYVLGKETPKRTYPSNDSMSYRVQGKTVKNWYTCGFHCRRLFPHRGVVKAVSVQLTGLSRHETSGRSQAILLLF